MNSGTLMGLLVGLGIETKDFDDGLAKAENKAKKSASNITNSLASVGKAALVGGLAAATAGMAALASTIQPASDLAETITKVGIVFGESASEMMAFGETAANSLGMSKNAALSAAATYGNLFRAMGLSTDKSTEMSKSLVKLAGDLASFNNQDPTEVLDKLRSGLSGEVEPLRSLGVNLNQAMIEAKAAEMGLLGISVSAEELTTANLKLEKATMKLYQANQEYEEGSLEVRLAEDDLAKAEQAVAKAMAGSTGEMTAAIKAQASYALIMEQTALAQGDFERTSDGLANQTRILKANIEDLKTKIGTGLLPLMTSLSKTMLNLLDSPTFKIGFDRFTESVANFAQKAVDNLPNIVSEIQRMFNYILDNKSNIINAIEAIGVAIGVFLAQKVAALIASFGWAGVALTAIMGLIKLFKETWVENLNGVQEKVRVAMEAIAWIVTKVWNTIAEIFGLGAIDINVSTIDVFGTIKDFITNSLVFISDKIVAFVNFVDQWWNENGFNMVNQVYVTWEAIKRTINNFVAEVSPIVMGFIAQIKLWWEQYGPQIISTATNIFNFLWGKIQEFYNFIKGWLEQNGPGIVQAFSDVWNNIVTFLTPILTFIGSEVQRLFENLQKWWAENGAALLSKFGEIWNSISSLISSVVEIALEVWDWFCKQIGITASENTDGMMNGFSGLVNFLSITLPNIFMWVVDFIATALDGVANFFKQNGEKILAFVLAMIDPIIVLIDGVVKIATDIFNIFVNLINGNFEEVGQGVRKLLLDLIKFVYDFGMSLSKRINAIGAAIIEGLYNALIYGIPMLVQAAGAVATAIGETLKGFLGIHSPSALTYGFGKNIMLGLRNGMKDFGSLPVDVSYQTSQNIAGGLTSSAGQTNNTYNNNEIDYKKLGKEVVNAFRAAGLA